MSNIVHIGNNSLTMSSREIAEMCGKEHPHVLRDIRSMLEQLNPNLDGYDSKVFFQIHARSDNGQTSHIDLDKELTLTLVAGYSVVLRNKIVKRWVELEKAFAAPMAFAIPKTLPDALRLAADLAEKVEAVTAERDQAIATKALIGSKREATAMATASAATAKARKLETELGRSSIQATITAVQNVTGKSFNFRPLRAWCKNHSIKPARVPDARYGHVKAWPAAAWLEVFGVDLPELFGGSSK